MALDLKSVRERWVRHNLDLIEKFAGERQVEGGLLEKLKLFAVDYLIDFESEMDEDPENEDGGILTLETVYAGYIDGFFGRWYIQKVEGVSEEEILRFQEVLARFYAYMKEKKLYREGSAQHTKLMGRLENRKKYARRLREYLEIQKEKGDEEKYLDLMREWEYEDLY
jgi:hypothetical protein